MEITFRSLASTRKASRYLNYLHILIAESLLVLTTKIAGACFSSQGICNSQPADPQSDASTLIHLEGTRPDQRKAVARTSTGSYDRKRYNAKHNKA